MDRPILSDTRSDHRVADQRRCSDDLTSRRLVSPGCGARHRRSGRGGERNPGMACFHATVRRGSGPNVDATSQPLDGRSKHRGASNTRTQW
ncbi:hypothetical protein [Ornithinimicrobium kibberense]|uniref:hypothetical protein n=1 Tax=Ornithinimicrobium kibberense TaxID=282060 RepID=UPI00361007E9